MVADDNTMQAGCFLTSERGTFVMKIDNCRK